MKTLTKKVKKGFTIVELVIVIAVIAILAAVLIPTFSNVISAANESVYMQECRAEWSNYLPEVAADSDFGDTVYYVAYDKDATSTTTTDKFTPDYYFVVSYATFDADNMIEVSTFPVDDDYAIENKSVDTSATYTYLNNSIRIYNATDAATAEVETAAKYVSVSASGVYYALINDGTTDFYFKLTATYDNNTATWTVDLETSSANYDTAKKATSSAEKLTSYTATRNYEVTIYKTTTN